MTFETWKDAVAILDEALGPATERQRDLALAAGLALPDDISRVVAAGILKSTVGPDLDLPVANGVTEYQATLIDRLADTSDLRPSPANGVEADAWIADLRLRVRRVNLANLRLVRGDLVKTMEGGIEEVSSIRSDGRVFFRGGRGAGAWPDQITLSARVGDTSEEAKRLRTHAANERALRARRRGWSVSKANDLIPYQVERPVRADEIDDLETVISEAQDERPVQRFLEKHPQLLTAILSGHFRYSLPQKRLSDKYVIDFLIGDVDSLGVRWILVELETPRSPVYLKEGKSFDKHARRGIQQVVEWREWIASNIAHARQRLSEGGLGMFEIRPKAKALVLVGRRRLMPPHFVDAERHAQRSSKIEVHTYDWLIDAIRGAVHHFGPPGVNPFILRDEED